MSARKIRQGATSRKTSYKEKREAWLRHHAMVAVDSLIQLLKRPLSSALTWMVIAIALCLPSLFYLSMLNMERVTSGLQDSQQISLYLEEWVSNSRGEELATELASRPEISESRYISASQGLKDFTEFSGLGALVEGLPENPLPNVIELKPNTDNPVVIEGITLVLKGIREVEEVQLDMLWVHRLNQIGLIMKRVAWVLTALFALAVVLVVGNTLRLAIESRREEVLVIKLIGATNAFVRRPFLYMGFWYGLIGGIAAWVLTEVCYLFLYDPVTTLASSFAKDAEFVGLNIEGTLTLLFGSISVSLLGAILAVGRHLRQIEPR